MRIKTNSLITGLLACLLLLSCTSVIHAGDDTRFTLKDGVIDDSLLGLQWVPDPDWPMTHYEAQNYVRAYTRGLGIFELPEYLAWPDWAEWEPLTAWLRSKRSQPSA